MRIFESEDFTGNVVYLVEDDFDRITTFLSKEKAEKYIRDLEEIKKHFEESAKTLEEWLSI
jgi:hypothetical protein